MAFLWFFSSGPHVLLIDPGPEIIKKHSMLNSAKHEIFNAPKYKNIKTFTFFQAQLSLELNVIFPSKKS